MYIRHDNCVSGIWTLVVEGYTALYNINVSTAFQELFDIYIDIAEDRRVALLGELSIIWI